MLNALATWSPMTVTVKVANVGTGKFVFTSAVRESPGCMVAPPDEVDRTVTFPPVALALNEFAEAP
jgi:hypothetical protein